MSLDQLTRNGAVGVLADDAVGDIEVVYRQRFGDESDFGVSICDTPPHIVVVSTQLSRAKQARFNEGISLNQHGVCASP